MIRRIRCCEGWRLTIYEATVGRLAATCEIQFNASRAPSLFTLKNVVGQRAELPYLYQLKELFLRSGGPDIVEHVIKWVEGETMLKHRRLGAIFRVVTRRSHVSFMIGRIEHDAGRVATVRDSGW